MAEFATIARPYAKALFSLAQEKTKSSLGWARTERTRSGCSGMRKSLLSSSSRKRELPKRQKRSKVLSVSKCRIGKILLPFWPSKSVCWYCRKFMPNIKI